MNNLKDFDKKANEIYGVIPYMAPEILRKKPYTQASDIYSFSMIMWEFTSGISPFSYRAHEHQLIYDICKDPEKRPTITEFEYMISEWIRCINEYYKINRDGNHKFMPPNVDNKLKDDMLEFVKADNTLVQEQANISTTVQSHSQAYYTSRNITEIVNSECLECMTEI
ncbi:hypothetical protein RclHR1_00810001 [Rhizophagus clarus]|uniref:Protein kinase domain-containing protein n=1 Tax=Rhizophagus clarus TaxID=94130 RepID=A0A2Z6SMV3_9GLOM|nr:hypothetical protein RclHR1_00810001 [Rhizophagus clarus]